MPIPAPHKILPYTTVAATALQGLAGANRIPFIGRLCTLALSIIPMVENTKFQKDRCLRILEDIHHLLCVLMALAIDSVNIEAPTMFHNLAQSARTLQKIESCLQVQRELGTMKRVFKQSEIAAQLNNCAAELKEVLGNLTFIYRSFFVFAKFLECKLGLTFVTTRIAANIPWPRV
ncbi:hypothetical protein MSAN_02400300 [Mycena sanguinolenta]|uniref:Uncharacterized protein n=1 Tax=Mycena sanguinolenta TaxID=230812 RepID=A0A8H6X4F7_9AGAR|nr:hypothetical protein MSAN_02400300 [Mycena sanguinolenta]